MRSERVGSAWPTSPLQLSPESSNLDQIQHFLIYFNHDEGLRESIMFQTVVDIRHQHQHAYISLHTEQDGSKVFTLDVRIGAVGLAIEPLGFSEAAARYIHRMATQAGNDDLF